MMITRLNDGMVLSVNSAMERITGYKAQEIIGSNTANYYKNAKEREQLIEQLRIHGHSSDYEIQVITNDGDTVSLMLSSNIVEYNGEQCIFSICRDVTQQKRVEKDLREKNRAINLLQRITVAANDSVILQQTLQLFIDEMCMYCDWPIGHVYILDKKTSVMESAKVWHINEPEKYQDFKLETEDRAIKYGEGLPGRVWEDKRTHWLVDIASDSNFPRIEIIKQLPLKSGFAFPVLVGNEVVAVLEFFHTNRQERDEALLDVLAPVGVQIGRIIERTIKESELQEYQVNFSKAVNASPESIIIIRLRDGKIIYLNDAVTDATVYERSELLESGNGQIFWTDMKECENFVRLLRRSGRVANYSMISKRKDGSLFPCLMSSSLMEVRGEKCSFNIINDVTKFSDKSEQNIDSSRTAIVSHDISGFDFVVSYIDKSGKIQFVNSDFEKEFCKDKNLIVGSSYSSLVGRTNFLRIEPFLKRALDGESSNFELDYTNTSGEQFNYRIACQPHKNNDQVEGVYVISTNVTEYAKSEYFQHKTTRALNFLSTLNKQIVRYNNETDLLETVCALAAGENIYSMAWVIDTKNPAQYPTLHHGLSELFSTREKNILKESGSMNRLLGLSVLNRTKPFVVRSTGGTQFNHQWQEFFNATNCGSLVCLPLIIDGKTEYALTLLSSEDDAFAEHESSLLINAMGNLCQGIQFIRESRKRKTGEDILSIENHVFQLINSGVSMHTLLDSLIRNIEAKIPDIYCSLMLIKDRENKLENISTPKIQDEQVELMLQDLNVQNNNPCDVAVKTENRIVLENIKEESVSLQFGGFADTHHLESCCISPITSSGNSNLGVLAVYGEKHRVIDRSVLQVIDRMIQLISTTVEKYKTDMALQENEDRFALAMRGTQDGLWDWNVETNEAYYSPRWKSMLGYSDQELPNVVETFSELLHEEDKNIARRFLKEFTEDYQVEFKMRHKEGHYVNVLSRAACIRRNESGEIIRFIGTHVDLIEQNNNALRMKESENKFRTLYNDSPSIFLTLGRDGKILSINNYGAEHLGMSVDSLIGKLIMDITHKEDRELFYKKLNLAVGDPDTIQRCEVRQVHAYGDIIWVRVTMRSILTGTGTDSETENILVTCEDVSEARVLSEQLEYQARHDALTGLINRREFEKRLTRVLTNDTSDADHALCYLDLDQFKVINDTCGHLAGDELLRRVSDILNTVVRKRDTLARMGGDEFAVLLEHCPLEQAKRVANELLRSIETLRFVWEGKRFTLGVSIGLVPMRSAEGTITDILSAADAACYAAKDAGRNRIQVYYSDDVELSRRRGEMEWVSRINHALEEDLFSLEVQSIQPLAETPAISRGNHYELLLRMRADDGELIYPGAFLPAAERYNLSLKIDRWLINATLNWLTNNPEELEELEICSINLSGNSMGDKEFHSFVLSKFRQTLVPPEKICFEITETAAIANLGAAIELIHSMKEIGCLFALDDFGTGVSSFNYLKNLPVDFLKIDGSFIREIDKDPIDFAMVKSINEIGQVMGKQTIAEFVENDSVLQVLRAIGVDYAQGYAIGKSRIINPMSA